MQALYKKIQPKTLNKNEKSYNEKQFAKDVSKVNSIRKHAYALDGLRNIGVHTKRYDKQDVITQVDEEDDVEAWLSLWYWSPRWLTKGREGALTDAGYSMSV